MDGSAPPPVPFRQALLRGLRKRCPRCGEGELFQGWHHLRERCPVCALPFEAGTGDTWFFMYMTTAGLTGALIVILFLIRPLVARLDHFWIGQVAVLLAALVVIGLSLPYRKGLAIALDYLVEGRAGEKGG